MKKLLVAVVVLFVVYIGLCLAGPSEVRVSRQMEMGHSSSQIFEQINSFENWENWSPWFELDPNATYEYQRGVGVGSVAKWSSNDPMVGNGQQTIKESDPNKHLLIDLEFEGQGSANAFFNLSNSGKNTLVEWGFLMKMPFFQRVFGLFIDFEGELGPTFEKGLNNMNAYLDVEELVDEETPEPYVEEEMPIEETVSEKEGVANSSNESDVDSEDSDIEIIEPELVMEEENDNEIEAEFIISGVGKNIEATKDNDLMNRAFEDISLIKKGEGICSKKSLGSDVILKNNNASQGIMVRVSIVWKDLNKKKQMEYKEYEIQPMEELHVGCSLIYPEEKNKGRWNIIHTEYR